MPVFAGPHFKRLLDLARRDRLAPLYIFIGDPQETLDKALRIISIQEEKGALCERLDLSENTLEDLLSALSETGLFGPRKLVLARSGELLVEKEGLSSDILKPLSAGTVHLLLLAREFPEAHSLYRFAEEKGAIVPLHLQKGRARLLSELAERLSAEGLTMERPVAEYFLSLVGEDYAHFRNELEKLILYAGGRNISRQDVEAIVSPAEEAALFMLGDVLLERGPEAARSLLTRLLDRGEVPPRILAALTTYFKRLWLLAYLLGKRRELLQERRFESFKGPYETLLRETWPERPPAALNRLHPYAAFRLKRHLQDLGEEFFPAVFSALYTLDRALKRDFLAPEKAFYRFFLTVYSLKNPGGLLKSSIEPVIFEGVPPGI